MQIGWANDIDGVKSVIADVAKGLNAEPRGTELIAQMETRLAKIPEPSTPGARAMYITSKGATAGAGTMIGDLIQRAGFQNFEQGAGWRSLPLEDLAYATPDLIVTGFFETSDLVLDRWTPTRHPVAQRRLRAVSRIDWPGAWTACGGWFQLDAIESLAAIRAQSEEVP